ncbi:hypothetical protein SteCoe_13766 [Stentor coeruleus]|uniref:SBF1/SBF2 domain-containing protein n=1 Tax=Stentor coeruleus TaxID=5963 RepID=A0A1R2C7T1_9CILI|nr:hypothetical protein SteCoe_13766 [Stentor coeruleus]
MNYLGLWDRFTDVRYFWSENKEVLEDFSNFIKDKAELDRNYGKGLEKLGKLPMFEKVFGTSAPTFQGLKTFYIESSEHLINQSNYLIDDVYTKLRKLLTSHDAYNQEFKHLGKKMVLEREKLVKNHLKCRSKYWKTCKENELAAGKLNSKASQQEENSHKSYMVAISQLNSFNMIFQENMKRVLQVYQDQNLEKMHTLRQVIQAFVAGEASNIYSMKMHLDNLSLALDTFNPDTDQKMFIDSTFTGNKIEEQSFISYAQSLNRNSIDLNSIKPDERLLNIINNCWSGTILTNEDKEYFHECLVRENGKKKLITLLNEKRKNGEFKIHVNTFKDLGELFNMALNCLYDIEHLGMAKQCIILSQTFFMVKEPQNPGTTQEKIYLQTLIVDHQLWKKEDYWEYMVENAVESALDSLNEFGDEYDKQNHHMKKKSVIISAIVSYVHMMASFNVEKNRVASVLQRTKDKYKISDDELSVSDLLSFIN